MEGSKVRLKFGFGFGFGVVNGLVWCGAVTACGFGGGGVGFYELRTCLFV